MDSESVGGLRIVIVTKMDTGSVIVLRIGLFTSKMDSGRLEFSGSDYSPS